MTRQYSIVALLIVAMSVAFVPFMVLIAYSIDAREREALAQEKLRLVEQVQTLAMSVDRELQRQTELAQALTTNAALRSGDLESFWRTARAVGQVVGGDFVLIDRAMQQVLNTRVPFGTALPTANDKETTSQVIATGMPLVGSLQPGAMFNEKLFAVRVPVRIADEVLYSLSYAARGGSIRAVVDQSYKPNDWVASVVDANGSIVARSLQHSEFYGTQTKSSFHAKAGFDGVTLETDPHGQSSYVAYRRSSYSGWTFLVAAPREVLEAPSRNAWHNLYTSASLAALIALVAALVANTLIRGPTLRLLSAARQLAEGVPVSYRSTLMKEANTVGSALGAASAAIEDRERILRHREQHLEELLRELAHRTKNLLAVVQAMASQSVKGANDLPSFVRSFRARIGGLSRSHDLLVGDNWERVELNTLVSAHIEPFQAGGDDNTVSISGPLIRLKAEAVQALGMALHELASNAYRYGALSTTRGQVIVGWTVASTIGGDIVTLRWREMSGPPCEEPIYDGFGLKVLKKLTAASLFAETKFIWHKDGCEWVLFAPLSAIAYNG